MKTSSKEVKGEEAQMVNDRHILQQDGGAIPTPHSHGRVKLKEREGALKAT